ncbi:MAG: hypothetical protein ACRDP6_02235 [Actinoallomurus sp.]
MKRQQLKVWTTSFVVSVIRHQSLVLFTAAGWSRFSDSANDAAQCAPVTSGLMTNFPRELRAVIHIAG